MPLRNRLHALLILLIGCSTTPCSVNPSFAVAIEKADRILSICAAHSKPPRWLQAPPLSYPHNDAFSDPRILADILLRLRNELPLATDPPTPLPNH